MKTGWFETTIGEIARIARGGSPRPIQKYLTKDPSGINWIKIGDATKSGKYILETEERIIPEGVARSRLVKEGDFLLSNSMSFGRPYIMKTTGCVHDGWLVLSPDLKRVDQDFLYHLLGAPQVFDQFDRLAAGSTVRNLNTGLVSTVRIPLPPLDEQKRIVAVLDEAFEGLFRARANAEANLAEARELYSNALDQSLLECGAPFSDLGGHVDQLVGYAFKSADFTENPADIRLMRGDNIVPGGIRWEGAKRWRADRIEGFERYYLQPHDVLIAMDRTWIKAGIKFAVVSEQDTPSLLVQRVARLRAGPTILVDFLAALIRSRDFERYVLSIQTGTGVPHISGGQINAFPVRVPDIETQARIMERLNVVQTAAIKIAANVQSSAAELETLRQSLMQKAFSGELT